MTKIVTVITAVFIGIEAICYAMILAIGGVTGVVFSYTSVVLAFVYSLVLFTKTKKEAILTEVALFFTIIADLFLVVIAHVVGLNAKLQIVAMTAFSFTQICYFLRQYVSSDKIKKAVNLYTRLGVTVIVEVVALIILKGFDPLVAVTAFYFTNLVINAIFAWVDFKKALLFAIGLTLFVFCDVFVGLEVAVGTYIIVPESSFIYALANPSFNAVWFFYLPSQTLLALSVLPFKLNSVSR